jgi:hypothetical protein
MPDGPRRSGSPPSFRFASSVWPGFSAASITAISLRSSSETYVNMSAGFIFYLPAWFWDYFCRSACLRGDSRDVAHKQRRETSQSANGQREFQWRRVALDLCAGSQRLRLDSARGRNGEPIVVQDLGGSEAARIDRHLIQSAPQETR